MSNQMQYLTDSTSYQYLPIKLKTDFVQIFEFTIFKRDKHRTKYNENNFGVFESFAIYPKPFTAVIKFKNG